MEHFHQLVTDPTVTLAEVEAHLAAREATSGTAAAPG